MNKILLSVILLVLHGCATTYQSGSGTFTGGHFNNKVNEKLEKIVFSANGYTDASTAQNYALFRSAEYANENNKPYFIMFASLRNAAEQKPTFIPALGSVGNKPAAFCYVQLLDDEQFGSVKTSKVLQELEKNLENQEN